MIQSIRAFSLSLHVKDLVHCGYQLIKVFFSTGYCLESLSNPSRAVYGEAAPSRNLAGQNFLRTIPQICLGAILGRAV